MKALICLLVGSGLTSVIFAAQPQGNNNVQFHGTLVTAPCVIPPGEQNITLAFGTIPDKQLYADIRTPDSPFSIHLTHCNTKAMKTVMVSLVGAESRAIPGLLALDAGSTAKGIAIGLETAGGQPLKLNQETPAQKLSDGDNTIQLEAYVMGEPAALADMSLKDGNFQATATFMLTYE
ncbi:Pilin (type 1 fimbria component protein) [Izhakiella capsodis]|uniref:Pilin (Type 1 fimbria component protein) n=1 Tax=Izhakiella capsodis TaxID=1367852 RepID=A0A1I4ZYL0_9GAMM|nr:fimbrial protein [Izhakiella capsodis]SFN55285.1 Pilin (type 1 fimbria component protein) [Izhakiella capsodis]